MFVNNTFARNSTSRGLDAEIYTNSSVGEPTSFYNNIIVVGAKGQTAVYCDNFNTTTLRVRRVCAGEHKIRRDLPRPDGYERKYLR
jgi:hypothetical protein